MFTAGAAVVAIKESSIVALGLGVMSLIATICTPILVLVVKQHQEMRKMAAIVDATKATADQVNRAVNCVGPNEPTLVDRIRHREARDQWRDELVLGMARFIGYDHEPPPTIPTFSTEDAA